MSAARALRVFLLFWLALALCWALGCHELPSEPVRAQAAATATPAPSPTPTPAVYWDGAIACSFQGGPPEPCPACTDGQATCTFPPGWTIVCLDSNGKPFPCAMVHR
jgi:hypothetical protein